MNALTVRTAAEMSDLGRAVAASLRAGDLVVLSGDLGAGKTTLTRGIGEGLGVLGAVTSPTFVIARVHPAPPGRPPLVHVDAYRLSSLAEVDDLDLDAAQQDSVTVVEWGRGLAEDLAEDRLEIDISRPHGLEDTDETRTVRWQGVGERWSGFTLA
jgi:tRNA threonylcarbamoyladenosine biosynthesis protein TsaE